MERTLTTTADDFGLTRTNTDGILNAAGALTRVSVLANGYAVPYALSEWEKRKDSLALSLHFNITEGKSVLGAGTLPLLTDSAGNFRYSSLLLLLRLHLAPSRKLRAEIAAELRAQASLVRESIGEAPLGIDGHQHVQMIPAVMIAITELHAEQSFSYVRVVREPFFLTKESMLALLGIGALRHFGLNLLSRTARRIATRAGIAQPDYFVGALLSGKQTLEAVESALGESARLGATSVEIGLHPGHALPSELASWQGDTDWHASSWRAREHELLVAPTFHALQQSFVRGAFAGGSRYLEIGRYLIAGGIATGTNLGLLYLFTEAFNLWYLGSAVLAYALATGVSFTLQKFWTFSHYSLERTRFEFLLYVGNNVLGFAFDIVGLYMLVEWVGLWYIAAQFILLALVALWNFFVFRYVIFAKPSPNV